MRFFFFLLFFCLIAKVSAQNEIRISEGEEDQSLTKEKDSVRRQYIGGFPDYFFIYPVIKQRTLNFELTRTDRNALLTYKPNNSYSLGLGVYLFEIGLEFAFAIPLRQQTIDRFGESEARDIQINALAKRWGVDAFYQRYSGFYITDTKDVPLRDEPYPQRPDIETASFGFTGHHVFNKKFSFRSSYNYSERQLSGRGSFVLFGSLYTFRVVADSSIVKHDRQEDFGNHVNFTRLRYTTFSIAPGYTYNLTYNNFFLNTTLAVGPAHYWINYDLEGRASNTHDIAVHTFIGARVAIGYNGDRVFGGISFISQGSTLQFDTVNFSNNNSVFKVLMGYRFNEFGILKKRVWDMLPFDL